MDIANYFKGFSKLSRDERFQRLLEMGVLTKADIDYLRSGGVHDLSLADNFIENSIGYFQLPMGVATNFNIDGKDRVIPMAVEETSIIAAASKTARWVRQKGAITTEVEGDNIIGQIQIAKVKDFSKLQKLLQEKREEWIKELNEEVASTMVMRGGGVTDILLRLVNRDDGFQMAVFHVLFNPCDAMGANMINQVCEYLKMPIEDLSGETVTMCILSNLVDTKVTVARVTMADVEEEVGKKIEEASIFAENDPYRAATNNKGVLNGIDPILIATGNDWRAVESGIHAYASRDGQYRSITKWRYKDGILNGEFRAPLIVGTVGGVTSLHPTARLGLNMLKTKGASDLSRVCAAVGLVQNLGALKALTTVGIIEGHMKLHIKNLTLSAGANESESKPLQKALEQLLAVKKRITQTDAVQVLQKIRAATGLGENSVR
ncbi:MAG: hydroxymethylglutaryl-CoA reductase, degradative [Bdellovibrionales bacterium]|nr:hydroxymethylglutaryl-CoA reductase, degradative [Bdellovibrionales bacterium]NQZ19524.1 hydroxymethylglutaryl-CoA reductase, degradative [Bdellovibrionales bacterium]